MKVSWTAWLGRGAARMLREAMEVEVAEYLGRLKYERRGEFRDYRQMDVQNYLSKH